MQASCRVWTNSCGVWPQQCHACYTGICGSEAILIHDVARNTLGNRLALAAVCVSASFPLCMCLRGGELKDVLNNVR